MKRKYWIPILAVVLIVVFFAVYIALTAKTVIYEGEFNLAEHGTVISPEIAGKSMGSVADAESAAEAANRFWKEVYGRDFKGKIAISYDSQNACWKVEGSLSIHSVLDIGYFPAALISEDGTVIDCWLGQF